MGYQIADLTLNVNGYFRQRGALVPKQDSYRVLSFRRPPFRIFWQASSPVFAMAKLNESKGSLVGGRSTQVKTHGRVITT